MIRQVAALVFMGIIAASAAGASPDPKDLAISPQELSKARELIKRLGSEVYREREDAHAALSKMGRLARPALAEAATQDADPEIRFRCSRLLPRAAADDLKARLDTFLADADGKYDHDLPGLKLFRKHIGGDEKVRTLFVEIVKSPYNVELLQALEKSTTEAGRAIADRRNVLFSIINNRNNNIRTTAAQSIQLPEIACLLFAESLTPTKDIPRTGQFSYVTGVNFLQQQISMNTINGINNAPHVDAYKKIVGQWMETRDDVQDLNQLYYVVGQQLRGFPQCVPLLRKIVNTDGVYGYAKGQAMMNLAQIRGKDEIPHLQGLLKNDTQVQVVWFQNANPNQQPMQHACLVRDVALAHILQLTNQKMTDYGFKFPPGVVPDQQIGYANYAFENETARAAALVKWGFCQLKYGKNNGPPVKNDGPKKDEPVVPPAAPIKR